MHEFDDPVGGGGDQESGWLTIDRGNSTLDCMWGGRAGQRARLDPTAGAFAQFVGARVATRVIAASVVAEPGEGLAIVDQHFDAPGTCNLRVERAGRDLPCPLELIYDTPETLGVDRWLGATAACALCGDAIVVDAGTALTVDAVTADGRYLGGAIAPGANTMAAGLAIRAPGLPAVSALGLGCATLDLPPKSSQSAVDVGVVLGFVAVVEGLVDRIMGAVQFRSNPTVVLTGGESELLVRYSGRTFQLEPDLIHAGLRCLLRNSLRSNS